MAAHGTDNTFFLATLGCKVNQYESQALREAWTARGLVEVDAARAARTVCISTCAVTAKAVADGRAAVRRAHRENPEAAIVVTGCAAQVLAREFRALPGVARVVPQQNKASLLCCGVNAPLAARGPHCPGGTPDRGETDGIPPYPPFAIVAYDRSRAVVKVQDGCSHRCTYCVVPLTRGESRSRPPAETLAEAERLLKAGFRELVLNGINLSQYGRDFATPHDFWDLVALLEKNLAPEWAGRARIRLSSLEPGQLGAKALDVLGESSLVAPHLHLSLQSGSRDVLRRMGRGHYDPGTLPRFCKDLAGIFPRFGFGADILSGFPGETDEDAAETEALCEALPFSYAHVFPYSRRPGTPAANWPGQLDPETRKARAARLRALLERKSRAFLESCRALPEVVVACELSEHDPERIGGGVNEFYGECRFAEGHAPEKSLSRALVKARPVGVGDGWLWVETLAEARAP
ncbi:MAG: MiaB/RimO family radical SAM methylthiotransferase [Deltaproteobacteria bacterium]|nr:MiaB/RimO family radical SAM methylthiotransferase [Deltaproteobacteria bacterium]